MEERDLQRQLRRLAERIEDLEERRDRILTMKPGPARDRVVERLVREREAYMADVDALQKRLMA